jgi:hypothetical protein
MQARNKTPAETSPAALRPQAQNKPAKAVQDDAEKVVQPFAQQTQRPQ